MGVPFPIIVAIAALAGYLAGTRRPLLLGASSEPAGEEEREVSPPEKGLRRRFVKTLLVWLVPLAVLLAAGGLVAELAGFFTVAALVTFGGAYAVLPFVATAAVDRFGWLTPDDMVAGWHSGSRRLGR